MLKLSPGEQFVAALVHAGDPAEFIRLVSVEEFLKFHELEAYEIIRNHVRRHGVVPKPETAEAAGVKVDPQPEPPSFYYEKLRARYVKVQLIKTWDRCNKEMRDDPLEALDHFTEACFSLGQSATPSQMLTLQDAEDVIWPRYVQRWKAAGTYGIQMGWKKFDDMTGGVVGGDLISFVGRPAQGKTQMLLWGALNVNHIQRKPVMFVSMEMSPELILERCVGCWTHVPLSEIKQQRGRRMTPARIKRFRKELAQLRDHDVPFHIIDGNLGRTVPDIYMLARQLKPAAIFIDGGYLLQHENETLAMNRRISANCNMMKQMLATELNVPTFVTWQINREGAKGARKGRDKKEDHAPSLENIAGADAIGQDSSLVCALLEEDSPETIRRRVVQILKGRSGEQGKFEIAWDWEGMFFGDYVEPKLDTWVTTAGKRREEGEDDGG